MIRIVALLLVLLAWPAYAQQGQAVGPVSPCSAFGTASGTCLQGAGALGSPLSIGTLPAFTLGGTISGGGNQLNNIVIGATSPQNGTFAALQATLVSVSTGATASVISATNNANTGFVVNFAPNLTSMGNNFAQPLAFLTSGSEQMRIGSGGAITMPNLASSSAAQTGTVCWTTGTGNLTVDTTTTCLLSAGKYKHDIKPLSDDSLAKVLALRPVSYEYNAELKIAGEQIGLLAEDVAAIDDRLVSHDPADGSVRAVRYLQLTAVLAGAIKQLKADNDNLRAANDGSGMRRGSRR